MGRTEEFGAVGRGQTFTYEAEALVIVEDRSSPLYDVRIEQPVPEWLVLSIIALGVLKPILVRRNGDKEDGSPNIEVVDGRQRVRATREANKRILADGGSESDLKLVPAVYKRLDARAAETVANAANLSVVDSPMTKAKKIQRYLDNGHAESEAKVTFGFASVAKMRAALSILECSEEVQQGIEHGELTIGAAREIARLPDHKQGKEVARLKAANPKRKTVRATDVKPRAKVRRVNRIEQLRQKATAGKSKRDQIVAEVLAWVLGDDDALKAYAHGKPTRGSGGKS